MINEIVTFFGNYGSRYSEVLFVASCVTLPYVVDLFEADVIVKTSFFASEEEATKMAQKFAFEGVTE